MAKQTGKKTTKARKGKAVAKGSKSGRQPTAEAASAPAKSGSDEAATDRRGGKDRRSEAERRKEDQPVAVERRKGQRRAKVNRRRQIDPTTCERDYTGDEIEFMNAMDEYKRCSGRMFPTCSEVLEVLKKLGYEKVANGEPTDVSSEQPVGEHGSDHQPKTPR